MFFLQAPPDTTRFMVAGYAVIFSVITVYLISLFMRWRNLVRDEKFLEELDEQK